jgi:hypothetical protein
VFISRSDFLNDDGGLALGRVLQTALNSSQVRTTDVRTCEPPTLEGTLKKLALVASAATALICAAALVAAPADAKSKKAAKKPAATTSQTAPGYGGTGGPVHVNGGPVRSGNMCWKDEGSRTQAQFGYWTACPKK